MKLWIDFETYCDLNIKKVGLYKYIYHPSFTVWCCGWGVNNRPVDIVIGEDAIRDYLEYIEDDVTIYAHNAEFEYNVIKRLGYDIPLKRFVDTMALAGTYGYPLHLDKFVKAIGLPYGKTAGSTRLINKLCVPQKKTIKNPAGRWYPNTAPEDFKQLYTYCKNDVSIMREAVSRLPADKLTPYEQLVWCHTIMQNERGIKIDRQSIENIIKVLRQFSRELTKEYQDLTGLNTVKQAVKLKEWFHEYGVKIPDLRADTVKTWLDKNIPHECRRVLQLRQLLAYSSTAKFEKMLWMAGSDDRVRGNLAYHAAHTGRWAGRGVQVHNLPRFSHDNPEEVLEIFNHQNYKAVKYYFPNLNQAASGLVRSVLIADDNKKFCVADYKSIENVVLHWCAGDEKTTKDFENGLCQYKVYSAARLKKDYDKVTKQERQQSKPDVLGLGYGGGPGALIGVAAQYGVTLSPKEAKARVDYYRKKYREVVSFWYKVYSCAKIAVVQKTQEILKTSTIKLVFTFDGTNLWIHLPSGRNLYYKDVMIDAVWDINVNGKKVPITSEISYMGVKNNVWCRIGTHPGMLVENIVQALARDCLAHGLLCLEQAGYKVLASVHDEVITEVEDGSVEEMCKIMCTKRDWCKTLPLFADGWEGYRYKKD